MTKSVAHLVLVAVTVLAYLVIFFYARELGYFSVVLTGLIFGSLAIQGLIERDLKRVPVFSVAALVMMAMTYDELHSASHPAPAVPGGTAGVG